MIRFVHDWLLKLVLRIRASSRTILGVTTGITVLTFGIEGVLLGWIANAYAAYDKLGMTAFLATPIFSLGVALIFRQLQLNRGNRSIFQIGVGATTAFVAALFLGHAMVTTLDNPTNPPIALPATPTITKTTPPIPSGTPVPSYTTCPDPDPTDPQLPPVEVKVVYWCHGVVLTSDGRLDNENYQIKVRPRLMNNTRSSMNISIGSPSAIRLLVTGKQIDQRWSPPPLTRKQGDRPILVKVNGEKFWAIPPNVPRDVPKTSTGEHTGFATSWDGVELQPGQSYFKPLRHQRNGLPVQEGNLVFQVPLDENGEAKIFGLVALDPRNNNSVLGIALFENSDQWGDRLHPTEF